MSALTLTPPVKMHELQSALDKPDGPAAPVDPDAVALESNASAFSLLTFRWLNVIFRLGSVSPLQPEDLPSLPSGDSTAAVRARLDAQSARHPEQSVLRAIWCAFRWELGVAGLIRLGSVLLVFAPPLLLEALLKTLEDLDLPEDSRQYSNSRGVWLSVGLFLVFVGRTLLDNAYTMRVFRTGLRIRQVLSSALFAKTIALSPAARIEYPTGKILSMTQMDTTVIEMTCMSVHLYWDTIVQIFGLTALAVWIMGPSALMALAVSAFMTPLLANIAKKQALARREMMGSTDKRVKMENEMLQGISAVKLYGWEGSFLAAASEVRKEETAVLRRGAMLQALSTSLMGFTPVLMAVVTVLVYVAAQGDDDMDATKLYPGLVAIGQLHMPMIMAPHMITSFVMAKVSLQRLGAFFACEEAMFSPSPTADQDVAVELEAVTARWEESEEAEPAVLDVSLTVPRGALWAVVGPVASGKSSLLSAILGELPSTSGRVAVTGSVAYVSQTAWILNATLRDNVLFGLPLDQARYERCLRHAQLETDLAQLPAGDMTEIGERGINLSGGQKQRVSVARALYADADVYLFDDPLSALDSEVGGKVFHDAIARSLRDKTCIVVTNDLRYMRDVDHIVLLEGGAVAGQGRYGELVESCEEFARLVREHTSDNNNGNGNGNDSPGESVVAESESEGAGQKEEGEEEQEKKKEAKKIIKAETRDEGTVPPSTYLAYLRLVGPRIAVAVLVLGSIGTALLRLSALVFTWWLQDAALDYPDTSSDTYMGVYVAIGFLGAGVLYLRARAFYTGGIIASRQMHDSMLGHILHAPLSFFETTPTGRMINRFSQDLGLIDSVLPNMFDSFVSLVLAILSTAVVLVGVLPLFLIAVLPLTAAYLSVLRVFRPVARELKRIGLTSRSPIVSSFSEALGGLPTIRSYRCEDRLRRELDDKLDEAMRPQLYIRACERWLSLRLETMSAFCTALAALLCCFAVNAEWSSGADMDAAMAGFVLTTSIGLSQLLTWLVRTFAETEANMASVQRVLEYSTELPQEPVGCQVAAPEGWPSEGRIEFEGVALRYRADTPLVLRDLSFATGPAEKIGVCGRTGAGKSSIVTVLFRLVEPAAGRVLIDGVDTGRLELSRVRAQLSIIPQSPVIFAGSVRFNLDPFGRCSDEALWGALKLVGLKEAIGEDLGAAVSEFGDNFSVGQRQLLCLARVVLRRTKILVLDEATSSVDMDTDATIQRVIRAEFADRTVLTIAHRINTIADSDRVLVLDDGHVVEFDTPAALLANPDGVFSLLSAGSQSHK